MKAIVLTLLLLSALLSNGQTPSSIKDFEITVSSFNFPMRTVGKVVLTKNELTILKEPRLTKDKDSILLTIDLTPNDTIKMISEINLDSLKNYYSNNCIDDGSQISVLLKKDNVIKSVMLDNYYHADIGTIIYFINSLVPKKYQMWYDKKQLIKDYQNCKSNN